MRSVDQPRANWSRISNSRSVSSGKGRVRTVRWVEAGKPETRATRIEKTTAALRERKKTR